VDLLLSPEQEAITASVESFLRKEMPLSLIRERRDEPEPFDREVWTRCADMGWFGLGLPEDLGGVGYTLAEEALLFLEIGRQLAPGPFLGSVLGARLAAEAGDLALAREILTGTVLVGLAQPRGASALLIGRRISGDFLLVDAGTVDLVLTVSEEAAALVKAADLGPIRALECIDPAVRLATATVRDAPAAVSVHGVQGLLDRGSVLVAAMQVGIATATRDMAVEYAKTRVQFGRPIGVNQAIKHVCSEMAMRVEVARSQLLFAALSVESGRPDAGFQVASAKVVADRAAVGNAAENIQVHGAMGYTYEHDAHLYVCRSRVLDRLLRDSLSTLDRLAALPPAQ
jgi:alkylation response protein AidB-like acyl-CoA dehydrogenase